MQETKFHGVEFSPYWCHVSAHKVLEVVAFWIRDVQPGVNNDLMRRDRENDSKNKTFVWMLEIHGQKEIQGRQYPGRAWWMQIALNDREPALVGWDGAQCRGWGSRDHHWTGWGHLTSAVSLFLYHKDVGLGSCGPSWWLQVMILVVIYTFLNAADIFLKQL